MSSIDGCLVMLARPQTPPRPFAERRRRESVSCCSLYDLARFHALVAVYKGPIVQWLASICFHRALRSLLITTQGESKSCQNPSAMLPDAPWYRTKLAILEPAKRPQHQWFSLCRGGAQRVSLLSAPLPPKAPFDACISRVGPSSALFGH